MLAQYRVPRHQAEIPSLSCSLVKPSSSKCCSASLKMPSLSGTLGAGLTGKAKGKCFCKRQIASSAGSWSRDFACGVDFRVAGLGLAVFTCLASARRRSRSSASCSKPIVQFTASWLIRGARLSHAAFMSTHIGLRLSGSSIISFAEALNRPQLCARGVGGAPAGAYGSDHGEETLRTLNPFGYPEHGRNRFADDGFPGGRERQLAVWKAPLLPQICPKPKSQKAKTPDFTRNIRGLLESESGGEGGIRTLDTVSRIHTFQACSFNRSDTSPESLRGVGPVEVR